MSSKQKTLHPASAIRSKALLSAAVWISCIAQPGPRAEELKLAHSRGDQVASLRLVAVPGLSNGRYAAGIEITMAPGSHTYWKQPGEAGVPPVFAFNGSANVSKAEVLFPVPSRISEDGIEAFGYLDQVVFPVEVTPKDATQPAELKVVVDYAVCSKICIPAHGSATLRLSPDGQGAADATADATMVKSALADVPAPLPASDVGKLELTRSKTGTKPNWSVHWSGAKPLEDVFPDAPEGFYFSTKKVSENSFTLTAEQVVSATKTTEVPVWLTLKRKAGSLVAKEKLTVAGSTN